MPHGIFKERMELFQATTCPLSEKGELLQLETLALEADDRDLLKKSYGLKP
jgi:hypothetical protein